MQLLKRRNELIEAHKQISEKINLLLDQRIKIKGALEENQFYADS